MRWCVISFVVHSASDVFYRPFYARSLLYVLAPSFTSKTSATSTAVSDTSSWGSAPKDGFPVFCCRLSSAVLVYRATMALLERTIARTGRRLLHLVEDHAARAPVQATLKGLVHHGRHARSKFVAHNLRDQVRVSGCRACYCYDTSTAWRVCIREK